MRMRRNRKQKYFLRNREVIKDKEGGTYEEYGEAFTFLGEVWPAGGKVQAEQYGEKLSYIRNIKIEGRYYITTDREGHIHYVYSDGLDVMESDGLCLYVEREAKPDYKVIAVKPYIPLQLEVERL